MNQYQNFRIPIIQSDQPHGWEAVNQGMSGGFNQLGALAMQKRNQEMELANAIAKIQMEAYFKSQFDPEAQFRNKILAMMEGGGGAPQAPTAPQGIDWQGANDSIGIGRQFPQRPFTPSQQPPTQQFGGFKPESFTYGGFNFKRPETQGEIQQGINKKVQEKIALKDYEDPTQGQETTALYAKRMEQADKVFDSLGSKLEHLGLGASVMQAKGPFGVGVPNFAKSEDYQSFEQAQRNFLNAVLRRESGAVISPTEFDEGRKQYFPQPGDKPAVLAQKKANRQTVIKSFIQGARKAYTPDFNNSDTQSKIDKAKAAGYSDEEIQKYLQGK